VFHADVAKVDRNVAYVAMIVHVCWKCVYLDVVYIPYICCRCFILMLHMFFMCFRHMFMFRMFQLFRTCMLQLFDLNVSKVDRSVVHVAM
jgi:hypothetical protein